MKLISDEAFGYEIRVMDEVSVTIKTGEGSFREVKLPVRWGCTSAGETALVLDRKVLVNAIAEIEEKRGAAR